MVAKKRERERWNKQRVTKLFAEEFLPICAVFAQRAATKAQMVSLPTLPCCLLYLFEYKMKFSMIFQIHCAFRSQIEKAVG